ncbi:penicillin-binding protein, partial [Streptomyces sp. MCAF7]
MFAAMVGVAGCGGGQDSSTGSKDGADSGTSDEKPVVKKVKTGPPSAAEVKATARDFLAAWSAGQTAKAAGLTDDDKAATAALTAYRDKAHIGKATLAAGQPTGSTVPFTV